MPTAVQALRETELNRFQSRKVRTVTGVRRRLDRFEVRIEREREKFLRVVADAEDAHFYNEDQAATRNAKHRYKEIGAQVKRNLQARHVTLYRYICRRWREAGYPGDGVAIPEPRLAQVLDASPRSIQQYKRDLSRYVVVEHGGRSSACRYRPALAKHEIARLQTSV